MIDQYGRTIEYLRISVTDRCNLRCVYCMPEEGIEQLPHEQILTFDEIERVCRISTELGISKIKLTGGEPHSLAFPVRIARPCSRDGSTASRFSFTAFGLPGKLMINV